MLLLEEKLLTKIGVQLAMCHLITNNYKAPVCCVHEVFSIQTMKRKGFFYNSAHHSLRN